MRKIKIVSRKYDGSLRDEYEAFLYAESDESLVVYSPPGTRDYDYRKQVWSVAPDGLLELYFKTRWYVVQHICEQNSQFNQSYVHLAMPVTVTATGIQWVDLDLDYRVQLDGQLERLDEPEYNEHKVSMGYPAEVQAQVQAACGEIEALYQQQLYPLDYPAQVALYQLAVRLSHTSSTQFDT
jgi:protein associated with RNAse G/E